MENDYPRCPVCSVRRDSIYDVEFVRNGLRHWMPEQTAMIRIWRDGYDVMDQWARECDRTIHEREEATRD